MSSNESCKIACSLWAFEIMSSHSKYCFPYRIYLYIHFSSRVFILPSILSFIPSSIHLPSHFYLFLYPSIHLDVHTPIHQSIIVISIFQTIGQSAYHVEQSFNLKIHRFIKNLLCWTKFWSLKRLQNSFFKSFHKHPQTTKEQEKRRTIFQNPSFLSTLPHQI